MIINKQCLFVCITNNTHMKFKEIKCTGESIVEENKKQPDAKIKEDSLFMVESDKLISAKLNQGHKKIEEGKQIITKVLNSLHFNKKQNKKMEINVPKNFFSKQYIEQKPNEEKIFFNNKRIYLYKTELCRSYSELGFCKYGDRCQFSHSSIELRGVNRHPKYKTETCRVFWEQGTCPYGKRCCFLHSNVDLDIDEPFEPKKQTLMRFNKDFVLKEENQIEKLPNLYSRNELYKDSEPIKDDILIKRKVGKVDMSLFEDLEIECNDIDQNEESKKESVDQNETETFIDVFFKISDLNKKMKEKERFERIVFGYKNM